MRATPHTWILRVRADRSLQALAGITLLALVLRLAMVWYARHIPAVPADAFDSPVYLRLGYQWSRLEPLYGTRQWPPNPSGTNWFFGPVYPLMIGAVQALRHQAGDVGNLRVWLGVVQALLGAWTVLLVGLLTRRMPQHAGTARVAGLVAAALLALWPGQILGTAVIMSEGLATPLFVTGTALLIWRRNPSTVLVGAAGAIFGTLAYVRYSAVPLLALAAPVAAIGPSAPIRAAQWNRERFLLLGSFALGCSLAMTPWIALYHAGNNGFFPADSAAYNLCIGNYDGANGRFDPSAKPCESEESTAGALNAETRRWILGNLDQQPRLIIQRLNETMKEDNYAAASYPTPNHQMLFPEGERHWLLEAADRWWRWAVVVSLVGLAVGLVTRGRMFRRFALLAIATLIGALTSTGTPRYHDALVPAMAIWSATALVDGSHWIALQLVAARNSRIWTARKIQPSGAGSTGRGGGPQPIGAIGPELAGDEVAADRRAGFVLAYAPHQGAAPVSQHP